MRSIFLLAILITFSACTVKEESKNSHPPAAAQEAYSDTSSGRSHSITYLDAQVEVDTNLKEINIIWGFSTSSSKLIKADGAEIEFQCGFNLESGSKITYELIDPSTLHLNIKDKILKLSRLHDSDGDNEVFGDWGYSELGQNSSQRWTFYIRDHDIMNVDIDCSYEFE